MIKLYIKKYKNKERFVLHFVTPPPSYLLTHVASPMRQWPREYTVIPSGRFPSPR